MKINIKLNKPKLYKYLMVVVGFIMLTLYIWFRFIKERLPREIPFNFSILGFFITIELCFIYAYIIFRLIIPSKKPNLEIKIIIDFLLKPLEDFDMFLKSFACIKIYNEKFLIWLVSKCEYIFKTSIFNVIFFVFPRTILIITFMIDIFYFHQLLYFYKVIYIGILLLLRRYILYSIKALKDSMYNDVKLYIKEIQTPHVFGVHPTEWPENYDPDDEDNDDWLPSMCLTLDIYIEFYINKKVYEDKIYPIEFVTMTEKFYALYPPKIKYDEKGLLYEDRTIMRAQEVIIENIVQILIQLNLILAYDNKQNISNKKLKITKIVIFSLYLISGIYILLVSIHTLNIFDLLQVMNLTWMNLEDPFINCQMINEEENKIEKHENIPAIKQKTEPYENIP